MDKFVTKRNDLLAEQVIKNLKSRQMEGHYVQTKEEALALALELIPEGSSISWGGSMSIKAIGLPEALHKGNYKVLDRDLCATPEEKAEMMHQAFNCDYFLASCNAISERWDTGQYRWKCKPCGSYFLRTGKCSDDRWHEQNCKKCRGCICPCKVCGSSD